jgi:inosine/xanthosine triphosphate pyrophosphatase family protein
LVVAQKATSAGVNVLIEDTSLDVDGADVGVNVRWIMDNLKNLIGRRAVWRVMLGVLRPDNKVYVYEGITTGTIVPARGDSAFGFDPVFLPHASTKTLAEDKPDSVNARCKAVESMFRNDPAAIHCPIKKEDWKGKWQH